MQKHRWGAVVALLALALALAGCSDGSDGGSSANYTIIAATAETITASALEGTKWTYDGGDYTTTLKFESGGNVTSYYYEDDDLKNEGTANYTVSGSTVVFSDGSNEATYIYFSGKLMLAAPIYTKDS